MDGPRGRTQGESPAYLDILLTDRRLLHVALAVDCRDVPGGVDCALDDDDVVLLDGEGQAFTRVRAPELQDWMSSGYEADAPLVPRAEAEAAWQSLRGGP